MENLRFGKLLGKVAVITASTDGIGFAIAKRLCEDGASVMISSRKKENVDKALAKLSSVSKSVQGTVCHVGKQEDRKNLINKVIEKFGKLDILVSNAGTNPSFGSIIETTEPAWDRIFDINLKSSFFLCKEAFPHLSKSGGSIVFVSSITAYVPSEVIGAYSVSKTALLGLVKALTPECARSNIRVNCIAPGIIDTKFSKALTASPEIVNSLLSTTPLNRLGTPDDCAGAVSFLVSKDAEYITGETIVINGGSHSRL